ncbi:hypothetical protein SAMN05421869_13040 [Nonomuraea jiangxiensis]|uniref:Uncharacterized protein n=1 Tax=Nonomuraea jiangxiensis TaxID=633440 RepID=A0A1G9MK82_9ACTN|nr:hypothetical protein [Nonomuraea jiangxiensis]SDL74690.1 hypothetical protein SAMN05421869_13040 [Nonomuraea jiangxiensis]
MLGIAEYTFWPLSIPREAWPPRMSCSAMMSTTPGKANRGGDMGSAQKTGSTRTIIATRVRRTLT